MNIGFFDSGLGGLSIYQNFLRYLIDNNDIKKFSQNINLYYIADSKHAPYGLQSIEFIQQRCLDICQFLLKKNLDLIVIACNTATANAIDDLRQKLIFKKTPLVGVEPAVKPACLVSKNHKIGILATKNTLQSARLNKLIEEQQNAHHILSNAKKHFDFFLAEGKNWVELIESESTLKAITDSDPENQIWQQIEGSITPLINQGIDTLLLGCTHYPFLQKIISQNIPQHIQIINNANAITQQIIRLYQAKNPQLQSESNIQIQEYNDTSIRQHFYSNANLEHMQRFIKYLVLENPKSMSNHIYFNIFR